MDGLFNFLQSLGTSFRNFAISFLLIFPLAFIDCWKLSLSFKNYELLPQIFMASGIGFMATLYGFFVLTFIQSFIIPEKYSGKIPDDYFKDKDTFFFVAAFFTDIVNDKWWFLALFLIASLPCLCFIYPLRKMFVEKLGQIYDKIDKVTIVQSEENTDNNKS